MRALHYAALVTTGAQETARERLHKALRLDSRWCYETAAYPPRYGKSPAETTLDDVRRLLHLEQTR